MEANEINALIHKSPGRILYSVLYISHIMPHHLLRLLNHFRRLTSLSTMTEKAVASFLEEDGGFPDDKIFDALLPIARELDHVVFHDPAKDINANYDQLITDVIHMRHKLREQLSRFLDPQNNSIFAESVQICTLDPANYEYAVATFAILALGGAVVPLRM